jgi:hypothetical protein
MYLMTELVTVTLWLRLPVTPMLKAEVTSEYWTLMSSRFILYTSPSIGYKKESFFFSHIHEYERISTFPVELPSKFFPSRTSTRTEDRESRPPEPRPCLRHLLGCAGRSCFWGAYHGVTACSFPAIAILNDSSSCA